MSLNYTGDMKDKNRYLLSSLHIQRLMSSSIWWYHASTSDTNHSILGAHTFGHTRFRYKNQIHLSVRVGYKVLEAHMFASNYWGPSSWCNTEVHDLSAKFWNKRENKIVATLFSSTTLVIFFNKGTIFFSHNKDEFRKIFRGLLLPWDNFSLLKVHQW